ncbi:hypothetical protein EMIHUDRAFT_242422 [Emiliania huxleyi CCMP1516]|uniref:DUF5710 domain-containing protein n=2 Tax=Emiliania huxleyi TaxID=2903 RepID=A0A0D3J9F0_EMIH1|nr:hypothetical protein EMIHUDRAFT_242422 [Emiliania huxleyi CCMP1516]EOD20135.1 hypothetical protein EMIHUDRAFT_242422 [Emiliania huxleyi CCMP1516]|eukprot:XP_005772564.1 hypothetical protein EMIHUDRAFT_242422 [Emiliania huxleyi CCMP1516]
MLPEIAALFDDDPPSGPTSPSPRAEPAAEPAKRSAAEAPTPSTARRKLMHLFNVANALVKPRLEAFFFAVARELPELSQFYATNKRRECVYRRAAKAVGIRGRDRAAARGQRVLCHVSRQRHGANALSGPDSHADIKNPLWFEPAPRNIKRRGAAMAPGTQIDGALAALQDTVAEVQRVPPRASDEEMATSAVREAANLDVTTRTVEDIEEEVRTAAGWVAALRAFAAVAGEGACLATEPVSPFVRHVIHYYVSVVGARAGLALQDEKSADAEARRQVKPMRKDACKALGGRWDRKRKAWYAPAGVDLSPFVQQWCQRHDLNAQRVP